MSRDPFAAAAGEPPEPGWGRRAGRGRPGSRVGIAIVLCFALGVLGGLGVPAAARLLDGGPDGQAAPPAPARSAVPEPQPSADPTDDPCRPALDLRARAAQALVVGLPDVHAADDEVAEEVLEVGVGGVLLTDANVRSASQVRRLVADLRSGSALPLLVSTDEEPGRVSSVRSIVGASSSARTLAARGTPADVRQFAHRLGRQLRALGIDLDLAPVVDLDDGPARGVIGDRSFSADPEAAAAHGLAFSRGLLDAGVLPTAKHFPGHGRSRTDSHAELAGVAADLDELRATDLVPFQEQVDAGVPVVMLGHVAYDALDGELPASLDPAAYALLRDMGFDGVAMTDSIGMGAVNLRWGFGEAAVLAVAAGADAVLATDGRQAAAMRDALLAAVDEGRLDPARLDEAAARMLALKGVDPLPLTCVAASSPLPLPLRSLLRRL